MKTNLEKMVNHAECTVYAFLPLLMAMAISTATQGRSGHTASCSSSSFLHRIVGRLAEPGNDATAVSRTGEADSSSMICWFAQGTCVWIAGVDSVRTITADSFEFLPRVCYSRCSVGASPWPWVRIAATHSGQGTPDRANTAWGQAFHGLCNHHKSF